MTPLQITQGAVRFIVAGGTNQIIKSIVTNNVEPENTKEKIQVVAGTVVVSGMVAEAARSYTDKKIESAFTFYNQQIKPRLKK